MFFHVSRAKVPVRTYALCLELMQNNMMQLHFVSLSAKLNCIIISLSPAKNCAQTATSALLMFGNLLSHSRLIICQSLESFTAVTKSLGVLVLLLWDIFLFARTQGCIQHRYFTQIFFFTWGVTDWMLFINQENHLPREQHFLTQALSSPLMRIKKKK